MYGAFTVNTWNNRLYVTNVVIKGDNEISGILYRPKEIVGKAPGIILAHGIANSKEPLSGLALELSKHGYVTLSIDLLGHGRSSGNINGSDPTLGVSQAAQYLAELPYVVDSVGLVGHSLGAGVTLQAATCDVNESGLVLIGGGIDSNPYSEFLQYSPTNLLVIIGRYDVLFNLETLEDDLKSKFPENTPKLDQRTGNPENGSMSMLLIPKTSHLLEPIDPIVVKAVIDWFNIIYDIENYHSRTYLIREMLVIISLILFIASIAVATTLDYSLVYQQYFNWRKGFIYGLIGFLTFLPAMLIGNFLPFPTQLFGSSIAWWLLIWGLVIFFLSEYWFRNSFPVISNRDLGIAVLVFLVSYVFSFYLENCYGFGFRIIVPIMRTLSVRRILSFFMYIPFMIVHFYSESFWFGEQAGNLKGLIISKIGIFIFIIFFQYGGFFLFNTILVSGFIGFILEFLVAIVPILIISSVITFYTSRNQCTGRSIILNSLLLSWIAAGLFPY